MLFHGARLYTARGHCAVPVAVLLLHATFFGIWSRNVFSLLSYGGIPLKYVRSTVCTMFYVLGVRDDSLAITVCVQSPHALPGAGHVEMWYRCRGARSKCGVPVSCVSAAVSRVSRSSEQCRSRRSLYTLYTGPLLGLQSKVTNFMMQGSKMSGFIHVDGPRGQSNGPRLATTT